MPLDAPQFMTAADDEGVATKAAVRADRMAFWASVGVVLAFTQFWVMLITGPPVVGPVDPAVSASLRNYFFPVYLATLCMAATRVRGVLSAFVKAPLLSLILLIPLGSLLWTIDPAVTERRWIAVFLTTLSGVVLAERFAWPRFLEIFAVAFAIVMMLCFALALALPSYGKMTYDFPGAWRGVWDHKNSLGYNMSVGFVVFAASAIANPKRRWLWIAAMAGALVLMLLSTSKTSLVSCLIGAGCIPLVAVTRRGPAWAVGATFLWVSAVLVLAFMSFAAPDALFGLVGKDATFTGRTKIWSAVLHQIAHHPMTGFGYGAVWDDTSIWGPLALISKEQGFVIHEAHNTFLGIWLELGYIGLIAWTLLFVSVWCRAMCALYSRASAYFVLPFLTVFSLHSFTESDALVQNDLTWLMFAAIAVKLALPEHSTHVLASRETAKSSTRDVFGPSDPYPIY